MRQAALFTKPPAQTRGVLLSDKAAAHDKTNLVAARLIAREPARYGGDTAGLVIWARLILERAQ